MKVALKKQTEFYQNLGKLFYAIAAADKMVHKDEVAALKKIINTDWLHLDGEKTAAEIDAMRQVKITFYELVNKSENAKQCLQEFKHYKQENERLFKTEVKELIWETANKIVNSFANKNKSELIILSDLGLILQNKVK
jgi:uncharacterized tellurite resistance protein B-like protein